MGSRDDARGRGRRRGERLVSELVVEWREMRLAAGLSQATVARSVGLARSTYADLERGEVREIGLVRAAALSGTLGGNLSVRVFPGGSPIRDVAHVALLSRLEARVAPVWRITHESPMLKAGDQRAWDRRLDGPISIGVEAETRPRDLQALERGMQLKLRDSGVSRMILVVAGTQRNRELVRAFLPSLRATFPLGTGETLRALGEGRDPGANGLVLI